MSLENNIKECIEKEIENGVIEKVIGEKLEECVASALRDMFSYSGAVTKVIDAKLKEVMVPYLDGYDYSRYIVKLDDVLSEVLKHSSLENVKLLENFKDLMKDDKTPKVVKLSDIFKKWCEYAAKEVDTSNLEESEESEGSEGSYDYLNVRLLTEQINSSWSTDKQYVVSFECEEDEKLNFEFTVTKWSGSSSDTYNLSYHKNTDVNGLRYLKTFEIYMMKLSQFFSKIDMDTYNESDEIEVDANPYE